MSYLTQCNYCSLREYKKKAKSEGNHIVLRPSNFMGGTCVFSLAKGEKVQPYIEPNNKQKNGCAWYKKHSIAWFAGLTDECCC